MAASDSGDIEKTRREEQSLAAKAKREAGEQARADKAFVRKALQAKRTKDARLRDIVEVAERSRRFAGVEERLEVFLFLILRLLSAVSLAFRSCSGSFSK